MGSAMCCGMVGLTLALHRMRELLIACTHFNVLCICSKLFVSLSLAVEQCDMLLTSSEDRSKHKQSNSRDQHTHV